MLLSEVEVFAGKGYFRQNGLNGGRWEIQPGAVFIIEINGEEISVAGFKDGTLKKEANTFFYRDGEIERTVSMRQSRLTAYSFNRPVFKERPPEKRKTQAKSIRRNGSK